MSMSMEDLCSSMSGSHVGQEALDLASLQLQLAQSLFCQSLAASSRRDSSVKPCNTPTGRTPSSSFSWGGPMSVESAWPTHSPQASSSVRSADDMRDEMDEDERMVEDLLIPSSPMSTKAHLSRNLPHSPVYNPISESPSSASLFATTDPFYLAQLQASQNYGTAPASVFSQAGFPSQQSPFMIHSNFARNASVQNGLTLDAQALLATAAGTSPSALL